MKYAIVFPGQGAQQVGMGKEFHDAFPAAKEIFESANKILGYDIKRLIFEGPEESLKQTINTQPAVFVTSIACLEATKTKYPKILEGSICSAGHSLGEYTALYAAGVFDFSTGLQLVQKRAEFIEDCCQKTPGTMAAIVGLDEIKLAGLCREMQSQNGGVAELVNFNAPGQIVISGSLNTVQAVVLNAKERGALKAIPLAVSGAFHSSLMNEASQKMQKELEGYNFRNPDFPVVTNVDAQPSKTSEEIKSKLAGQINRPVLWEKSVKAMIESGADAFIEIGPGNILTGLAKRIDKRIKTLNVSDIATLDRTIAELTSAV